MKIKRPLLQRDIEAYFSAEREIKKTRHGDTPQMLTDAIVKFHTSVSQIQNMNNAKYNVLAEQYAQLLRISKISDDELSAAERNGISLRAAVAAGILEGCTPDDIDAMPPYKVTQLTVELSEALNEAYEVPKN